VRSGRRGGRAVRYVVVCLGPSSGNGSGRWCVGSRQCGRNPKSGLSASQVAENGRSCPGTVWVMVVVAGGAVEVV